MSEMLEKIILNFLQKIMVTNAFGSLVLPENMMQKKTVTFGLFIPVLSRQNWNKLDHNWGNFQRCQKCLKK